MQISIAAQHHSLGLYLCFLAVSLGIGGCGITKASTDTTMNFTSSTSPNDRLSGDGLVLKEQKINLFTSVAYKNLQQEAAAGGGPYVTALASLYGIAQDRQAEFRGVLQRKYADLFAAGIEEDRTAHLKLVSALNRELATAWLLP